LSSNFTSTLPSATTTLAGLSVAQSFTVGQTIVSNSTGNIPLILQGAASQSANLLEARNSSSSILCKIDSRGYIGIGNTTTTNTAPIDIIHADANLSALAARVTQGGNHPAIIRFEKSRNNTAVFTNDRFGEFQFAAHDGVGYKGIGGFGTICTGTPSSNNIPSRLWIGVSPGWNTTNAHGDNTAQMIIDGRTSTISFGQSLGVGLTGQTEAIVGILNSTSSKKCLTVKAHTGQSANIFEIQQGGTGHVFFGIEANGGLLMRTANNQSVGSAKLNSGTAFVPNTFVSSTSYIFLSPSTTGTTPGHLSYTSHAGNSFTINSSSATDDRFVNWFIIKGV
jgi:hypothetical protein